MIYRAYALGAAMRDVRIGRIEETPNFSPRLADTWLRLDPPVDIRAMPVDQRPPYCAAMVQDWTDTPYAILGGRNPLDSVRQEALVESYADWADEHDAWVEPRYARPGHLMVMKFGANPRRFDHIGLVLRSWDADERSVRTIEANTGNPETPSAALGQQREGEGVWPKIRTTRGSYATGFIAWDEVD